MSELGGLNQGPITPSLQMNASVAASVATQSAVDDMAAIAQSIIIQEILLATRQDAFNTSNTIGGTVEASRNVIETMNNIATLKAVLEIANNQYLQIYSNTYSDVIARASGPAATLTDRFRLEVSLAASTNLADKIGSILSRVVSPLPLPPRIGTISQDTFGPGGSGPSDSGPIDSGPIDSGPMDSGSSGSGS